MTHHAFHGICTAALFLVRMGLREISSTKV